MLRIDDDGHAEHFVQMCRMEREKYPLSPPPARKPKRRVSRDFVSDAIEYDQTEYEARMYFLRQAS